MLKLLAFNIDEQHKFHAKLSMKKIISVTGMLAKEQMG